MLNIDWIPQGNAVLVSGPGVLQRVSMNGSIMPVSRTGTTGTVTSATWSPMDSQVVIQTRQPNGDQAVFLLNSGHDEVTEINVLHDTFGPSITNLQWLPSGLGLVIVAGNVQDDEVMNGQLYVYRFGEPVPMLVATSGQGGPTGTISHAVVSPDGQSVAYAIMVRDLDEWRLHSLWVRPLRGGPAVSIPLATNAPITTLFWSSEGLVWQQLDGSISVVDGDLQPRPLGEAPVASPVASPVATPVGSPAATPVQHATPRG
jgi:WD40 repeat protein